MKYIEINGKEIGRGETVSVDHIETTFTVTLRSLQSIGDDTLKRLIQRQYEVIGIKTVDTTYFVRASEVKDFLEN